MTIPKLGFSDSKHRLSINLYLGSKKWSKVGIPGKESWHMKIGVSNWASRSSCSSVVPREAYVSGKARRRVERRVWFGGWDWK
jgi:hypothetical protein